MANTVSARTCDDVFFIEAAEAMATFSRIFYRWLWANMKAIGSGPGRQNLLSILQAGGPKIMSAISAEMNESPRVITDAVDSLEALRLLRRVSHPTDRRAKLIEITPEGEEFLEASRLISGHALADMLSDYSASEQDELLRTFTSLLKPLKIKISEDGLPSTVELAAEDPKRYRRANTYAAVIRKI